MPDVERLTFKGNIGYLYRDDGSVVTMVPTVQNQWIPENGKQYPLPPGSVGGPTIAITAPTPMMIPSAVSTERILFRRSARYATLNVGAMRMGLVNGYRVKW